MSDFELPESERANDPMCNYKGIMEGEKVYYTDDKLGVLCAKVLHVDYSKGIVELLEMPNGDHGFMPYDLVFATIDEAIDNALEVYREWLDQAAVDCIQAFKEDNDVQ